MSIDKNIAAKVIGSIEGDGFALVINSEDRELQVIAKAHGKLAALDFQKIMEAAENRLVEDENGEFKLPDFEKAQEMFENPGPHILGEVDDVDQFVEKLNERAVEADLPDPDSHFENTHMPPTEKIGP